MSLKQRDHWVSYHIDKKKVPPGNPPKETEYERKKQIENYAREVQLVQEVKKMSLNEKSN